MKKYKYALRVKAFFLYTIEADSEKEAREILDRDGGIEIDGKLITEGYDKAHCFAREKNK